MSTTRRHSWSWTHAVLLLTLPNLDLWPFNPKTIGYHLYDIPRSFPIPSLNTSGSFVFLELCSGQIDRQTHEQTAMSVLPSPTNRIGAWVKVCEEAAGNLRGIYDLRATCVRFLYDFRAEIIANSYGLNFLVAFSQTDRTLWLRPK